MKIWITGVAGFLGSHLAEELLKLDHKVGGNDSLICGDKANVPKGVQFELADCRDQLGMQRWLGIFQPEVLIHCAATAHEGLSNFSPSFITRNIYEASIATFSAAIASGVKRIIFMSSMARYGSGRLIEEGKYIQRESLGPPFYEEMMPEPIDPYGIAKVAAEYTLQSLCKLHNVEYVIAVPHNIIGQRQKYDDPFRNVASIMINRALQNKPIYVYGDGQQKRCFSPIKDCLDSLVKMVDADISGEIINIGPDAGEISVLQLAHMIRQIIGDQVTIEHLPDRPNEVKNAYCSSDKARQILGYSPKQSLHECLVEMVEYIREKQPKPFAYNFPIEIESGCPKVWTQRML